MLHKIFFDDKPLFLTDKITPELEPYLHHDDTVFIDEFSLPAVKSMIHEMSQPKVHAGIFLHDDLPALQKAFQKKFVLVEAAGGAVLNGNNELLMIFRRGKWDLPKGKMEPGENAMACAVREVQEETGLEEVQLIKPLLTTHHTYNESGHHILKPSHWFLMRAPRPGKLTPQTEEDILETRWVPTGQLEEYLSNTFPSIRDVIGKLLPELRGFY